MTSHQMLIALLLNIALLICVVIIANSLIRDYHRSKLNFYKEHCQELATENTMLRLKIHAIEDRNKTLQTSVGHGLKLATVEGMLVPLNKPTDSETPN